MEVTICVFTPHDAVKYVHVYSNVLIGVKKGGRGL